MLKRKPVTKAAAAARGILATEGKHGTQAAPRLASGMETAVPAVKGCPLQDLAKIPVGHDGYFRKVG